MKTGLTGPPALEWAVASRALAGETESGDAYLVRSSAVGTLVAVVDGLGHGCEAAAAARAAVRALEAATIQSVADAIRHCHSTIAKTRGAAVSIVFFEASDYTLTWLGVGNVQGVLVSGQRDGARPREHLFLRGGVVGFRLPPLRPSKLPVVPGDTLILATDGIDGDFVRDSPLDDPPARIAERILARHRKVTDDALVLVARHVG
ncbi:MAG: SpoIIE family protein phosphatase [Bacteroidota bacterium]